jgi:mannose-6-phosphate isomerase-like protein (cupin superfamily)
MGRRPSPRPSYDKPTATPYSEANLHLWGDEEAGYVEDRVFVSSDQIHQLELSLPPGGRFQHSDQNRTIFAADELYYVLEGTLVIANPATGEVQRVRTGEGVFFRRDTWHHGYNYDAGSRLRVLELFAPPPSQGTSSTYARTKDNVTEWAYHDNDVLTRWPMNRAEVEEKQQFRVLRDEDLLCAWRTRTATCSSGSTSAPSTSRSAAARCCRDGVPDRGSTAVTRASTCSTAC